MLIIIIYIYNYTWSFFKNTDSVQPLAMTRGSGQHLGRVSPGDAGLTPRSQVHKGLYWGKKGLAKWETALVLFLDNISANYS